MAKRPGTAVAARRPRDQGGRARRPAGARAPRRLRAAVRGRARAHLPDAARAEEPLRLDQRGRRVRDARGRPRRGRSTPARASWARRRRRPGIVVLAAMEGTRPLLVEVQALVSPTRARAAAAGRATGSTATAWRWSSRCSPATRGVGVGTRRRLRQRRRRRAGRRAGRRSRGRAGRGQRRARGSPADPSPLACFGEVGPHGRAALGRPPRAPRAGGGQVRAAHRALARRGARARCARPVRTALGHRPGSAGRAA